MAWTDQCRIAAVETINKVTEDTGVSVRKAIAEVSKAADIPVSTLDRWYYPRSAVKSNVKNDVTPTSDDYNTEEQKAIASGEIFDGQRFATMAIEQLRRIKDDDPDLIAALVRVQEWISNRLQVHSR